MKPSAFDCALDVGQTKAISKHDLALIYGCGERHAREVLRVLHADGKMYIASWCKSYTKWLPEYRTGQEPDKRRPPTLTKAQVARRYRARHPEKTMLQALRKRVVRTDAHIARIVQTALKDRS